jgi:hypothetical protein
MAIAPHVAEGIVREHKYRPIVGDVLLLGRQTMQFTPEHACDMLRAEGLEAVETISAIDAQTRAGRGHGYITDSAFFQLLGAKSVRALDHADYEGAELVHDLNRPIPDSLAEAADFILDGSTLDNLFSPAAGLENMARMLRPGGRMLSINSGTGHSWPYAMPTGYWFLDYCALNRFADCKVYLIVYERRRRDVFAVDPLSRTGPGLATSHVLAVVAFAEKDAGSTWDRMPVQRQYAGAELMHVYLEQGQRFAASPRPELIRSRGRATLAPSVVAWMHDYFRTRWVPAGRFDRVLSDGRRRRSWAASAVRSLREAP